jgi:phage host-nuclease inhibitor protein Gam
MTIKESRTNNHRSAKIKDLKISKKKMVETVLQWCESHHSLLKNSGKLSYKINYYNHTKLEGSYCGYTKNITIYITPEKRIIDVVDTLLHEYKHHIDIRTQKEIRLYSKQLSEFGYDSHPMEVVAREFARQHRDECFETFKNNWV